MGTDHLFLLTLVLTGLQGEKGVERIAACAEDEVLCFYLLEPSYSGDALEPLTAFSHPCIDGWDRISGFAFTSSAGVERLHFAMHLYRSLDQSCSISWPATPDSKQSSSRWSREIAREMHRFNYEKRVNNATIAKVWDVASSPLSDHIATCFSLLPDELPSYIIPNDQQSVVSITAEEKNLPSVPQEKGQWGHSMRSPN